MHVFYICLKAFFNVRLVRRLGPVALLATMLSACAGAPAAPTPPPAVTAAPAAPTAAPNAAPTADRAVYRDAQAPVADRVNDLLGRMTIEEKIGQMTQADIAYLKPESDIATSLLGSLLSGGDSDPASNTPEAWANLYDRYQSIALTTRLGIPILYGIDAVHGHNNVLGATIFPQNIGLGATRNPALLKQIGEITAQEMLGTGMRWTFAPCLCVARDERWGRTYESYGENPEIGVSFTTIIDGLQGASLSAPTSVMATAKHFVGDGGTTGGVDQGNTELDEATLRAIHLPPYVEALKRGVGTVMVSYSSFNGQKMHANAHLINDVLKGELGFKGFVISDWGAVKQLPGDYPAQVRAAINAGVDMVMVPDDYKLFISTLRAEVAAGRVPQARIDDAVRRILTKKFELGLFERPKSDRSLAATIGSPEHRAVARDAVRQSLVLLKNDGKLLPLPKTLKKIYVAGKNADDIGNQSGGWTISWQGSSGKITTGTTILQGIRRAVAPDATVTYGAQALNIDSSYDVAIVVAGETPYAEMKGDRPNGLGFDQIDQAALDRVKAAGVPTVVVLVAGRPLVVTERLPDWGALVMAWLPGSEGAGVADVLFGDYKPTGKLPISWPRSEKQLPSHPGDAGYDPLFAYGYGLTYP
jgi:beta-glucosidase